jgi:epoxyqueuosine reductase
MALTTEQSLKQQAEALGFDVCGIAAVGADERQAEHLAAFIAEGRHGDMNWLASTSERRKDPSALWPEARSAIMLGMNYGPNANPLERLENRTTGNISVYAFGRDYHGIIKGKLKHLASHLASRTSSEVKVFVDTAHLME